MKCLSLQIARGSKSSTLDTGYLTLDNCEAHYFDVGDKLLASLKAPSVTAIGPSVMRMQGFERFGQTATGAPKFQLVEWFARFAD